MNWCATPYWQTAAETPPPGFKVISGAIDEPMTLERICDALKQELGEQDGNVMLAFSAARAHFEKFAGVWVARRTVENSYSTFPSVAYFDIPAPPGPISSITGVTYVDENGDPQTLDTGVYTVDDYVSPPVLRLNDGEAWPEITAGTNAVKLRYVVGYDDLDSATASPPGAYPLEPDIAKSILLLAGHFLENLEAVSTGAAPAEVQLGFEALARKYRVLRGMA